MVSLTQYGSMISNGVLVIDGLSTDTKPLVTVDNAPIKNGSVFYEMDTQNVFKYDEENRQWLPQQ